MNYISSVSIGTDGIIEDDTNRLTYSVLVGTDGIVERDPEDPTYLPSVLVGTDEIITEDPQGPLYLSSILVGTDDIISSGFETRTRELRGELVDTAALQLADVEVV